MSKFLLRNLWFVILFTACVPASRYGAGSHQNVDQTNPAPVSQITGHDNTDTVNIDPSAILANRQPLSLLDLPQTENGETILNEGFYEADYKSYCLQPGTPDPTSRDAYLQAPLNSYRKDIVETALRNSQNRPDLEQKNIQLLLWSVVSGSDYNKLSHDVRSTARQLLSSKQIFELKGGMMGVVKTIAASFPETGSNSSYNSMRKLFEIGSNSYEAYERIAVLRQPSIIRHADYKIDQWYKQEDGYYLRYFPDSYKKVKIQVYVPEGSLDSTGKKMGDYLLFDPVNLMAIPANSNSQRLGIGAPVVEVIRKVIQIQKNLPKPKPNNNPKAPAPPNKNPKSVVLK